MYDPTVRIQSHGDRLGGVFNHFDQRTQRKRIVVRQWALRFDARQFRMLAWPSAQHIERVAFW